MISKHLLDIKQPFKELLKVKVILLEIKQSKNKENTYQYFTVDLN